MTEKQRTKAIAIALEKENNYLKDEIENWKRN